MQKGVVSAFKKVELGHIVHVVLQLQRAVFAQHLIRDAAFKVAQIALPLRIRLSLEIVPGELPLEEVDDDVSNRDEIVTTAEFQTLVPVGGDKAVGAD